MLFFYIANMIFYSILKCFKSFEKKSVLPTGALLPFVKAFVNL